MPTIIDELVTRLTVDSSGLVKGQKDASNSLKATKDEAVKQGKDIETSASKAGDAVNTLARRFLALFALVTAGRGIKEFVSDVTSSDAALGRMAKNIDMSGRSLSTWQGMAVAAGGSAEGITGSMQSLSGAMQEAALTGNNKLAPVFRALHIDLATTGGKARDVGEIFKDLNRRYNQGDMSPARFTSLMHMIGVDDGTTNLLELTTEQFDKLQKEMEKYAATAADIDAAQKRQMGWRELLIVSTSIGRTILTELTPSIVSAMKAVREWADANQEWLKSAIKDKVKEFTDWIKDHQQDIKKFGEGLLAFATAAAQIAIAFANQSPMMQALEALALLLGSRILLPLQAINLAFAILGRTPVTGLLARLLGFVAPAALTVGAVAAGASAESTPNAETQAKMDKFYKDNPKAHASVFGYVGDAWNWGKKKLGFGGQDAPTGGDGGGPVPTGAHDPLKDLIAKHETGTTGAGGYDTVYGHAERGGALAPPKPITQMTIGEILAYQAEMKPRSGAAAFPVGRGQWVEHTLRGLTKGMDPNTVFTPELQEKLLDKSIAGRIGQGPAGFRSEWDSFRSVSDATINAAIEGHRQAIAAAKAPTTAAPVGLSITTPAAAAEAPIITDSQVFAARQRIANGSRDPADAELVKRYLAEQNAPAKPFHPESGRDRAIHHQQAAPTLAWPTDKSGNFQQRSPLQAAHEFADSVGRFGGAMKMAPDNFAPTYDDAARHVLKSLRGANDNRPVKVDITDGSAERIGKVSRLDEHMARALGRTAWHGNGNHHAAGAGERAVRAMSYATNITTHHHHDHTSDTKIGQITVHTQATDGRGVAADIGPALRRNSLVTQANGALA